MVKRGVAYLTLVFVLAYLILVFYFAFGDFNGGMTGAVVNSPFKQLDGTFLITEYFSNSEVSAVLDDIQSLGMDTLIIYSTRTPEGNCANPSSYVWLYGLPSKLGIILDEAEKRNMKVYVGLTQTMMQCASYGFLYSPVKEVIIADNDYAVKYIVQNYGNYTSLAGWYIPDELGVNSPLESYYSYYSGIVSTIRMSSDKPIMIAPFLLNSYGRTPAQVGQIALNLKNLGINIQAWQDSVGQDVGGLYSNYGLTINDYYRAISEAIGKDSLWSDNELFNYGKNIVFGTVSVAGGGAYKPTSISRLNLQLALSDYSILSKRVVWAYNDHMNSHGDWNFGSKKLWNIYGPLPSGGSYESHRLYDSYRALYGFSGKMIKPISYTWNTPPSSSYPDNNELFDNLHGNPTRYDIPQWAGVFGNTEIVMDFGVVENVKWAGANVLNFNGAGITFPDKLKIFCSEDNFNWIDKGSWNLQVTKEDGNYFFSNTEPLNANCRYFKMKFENNLWVFIDEIEIVGTSNSSQTCTSFTYSAWSPVTCPSSQQQTRTILTSSPSGCINGNPESLTKTCVYVAPCTEANWQFSIFPTTCPSTSQQIKTWTLVGNCNRTLGINHPATETISCTYVPNSVACTGFSYSGWGECLSSNSQTRTIISSSPTGCVGGNPITSQSCNYIPPCLDNDWTSSVSPTTCPSSGNQTKTWNLVGTCNKTSGINKPNQEIVSCNYVPNSVACTNFSYFDWGECLQSNVQTRAVNSSIPMGCVGGNPIISQACVYVSPVLNDAGNTGTGGGGGSSGGSSFFGTNTGTGTSTGSETDNLNSEVIVLSTTDEKPGVVKTIFIKFICRISNLFNGEKYTQCVIEYVGVE